MRRLGSKLVNGLAKKSYPYLLLRLLTSGTSITQELSRMKSVVSLMMDWVLNLDLVLDCRLTSRFLNADTSVGFSPRLTSAFMASLSETPLAANCCQICITCWSESWETFSVDTSCAVVCKAVVVKMRAVSSRTRVFLVMVNMGCAVKLIKGVGLSYS